MATGQGLAILGAGGLNFLSGYLGSKKRERELEQRRNQEIEDNLDKRLYEMATDESSPNPRAASYLDKKYGLALDENHPGFGALARPYVSLGELDRSKMLSPTDVRLSNLRQGEDFRNFESRVAPQAQERSSSAFMGPFGVGAEMSRRKIEEERAAKDEILQRARETRERASIDEAYKSVDELAEKGLIELDDFKKVLQGKQEWLKSGDKSKIYMPQVLSKAESAAELRRMDQVERNKNAALNNVARSYDYITNQLTNLQKAKNDELESWNKIEQSMREANQPEGNIETLKHKRLYKRWNELDAQIKTAQDRQVGLLERESKLLGDEPGKMAGKPEPAPDPGQVIQKRAEDFQLQVYNDYLSGLQKEFENLAETNRPNLAGGIFASYDPVADDSNDLRNFVQGTLGLENYDVRNPESIYQAMKQKALEKMQGDFAQAYPELVPKQEQKPQAPENLRSAILRLLQLSKVTNPEQYVGEFYSLNPDWTLEELNAKIQELENAGR